MSPLPLSFHPFITVCSSLDVFLVFHVDLRDFTGKDHFQVSLYSFQDTLKLGVAFDMTYDRKEEADWQRFDDMVRTLRSQMPTVPIYTILGFNNRDGMLEFAEALPSRMSAVAGATTMNYAMEEYDGDGWENWSRVSLDSELRGAFRILLPCPTSTDRTTGELKRKLWDVYPIEAFG